MSYRIGEFARLSGVSVKTLRFYDQVRLVRPARIDPRTRYRFYSTEQLKTIATIRALRASGLSIAEVRRTMRTPLHVDVKRAALESARTNLHRSLAEIEHSLLWIDALLLTKDSTEVPITIKHRPAMQVAAMRAEVARYEEIDGIAHELERCVPERDRGHFQGVQWHRCMSDGQLEGEPVIELKRHGRGREFNVASLPATEVVTAYSSVDDASAERAYSALSEWMRVFDRELAGAKCEIALPGMLEIQFPVRASATY